MELSDIVNDNDVVISGLSIRLPGITSYEKLTDILISGEALNSTLREKVPRGYHGNFPTPGQRILASNELDSVFFGMNNNALGSADRNQLKSVELSTEALIDAGFVPSDVQKFVVEVFQNPTRADGEYSTSNDATNRLSVLGRSRTLAANRVSFHSDFKGESVALDSNQTGSMAVLEQGWRDIKNGRCDMAIVISGNIFIDECVTTQLFDKGWLSADGETKSFDNQASGYQRSEAVVSFVLQRAKTARRIYTRLLHVSCETAINAKSMETPTKENWVQFLTESYKRSGIEKEKIRYLEAYGSGIKELDASELNAAAEFYNSKDKNSLLIGSVKSNIGHTDGASDMMSIIKAIVCFQNGIIPANRSFSSPNVDIPALLSGQLKVVEKNLKLPDNALIAVNGYSFGNIFGHCVLAGFHKAKSSPVEIPRLVPVSARLDEFIPGLFDKILESQNETDYLNLVTDVFSRGFDRHLGRGYMILSQGAEPIKLHQEWNKLEQPLWFVFSGMGSQWPGMGRDLRKLPLAEASLQKCHDILLLKGLHLFEIITSDDPEIFNDNLNSFVGIAAIQIALVDVLSALKIVPDGIIGHSLGELGCAFADGTLTLEQTILSAYYRGKAVKDATLERGAMAAIGKSYEELKNSLPENVEVACHNSNSSTTISGMEKPVLDFVEKLKADRVFAKVVEVGNIGFHSKLIAPAGPYLISYMKQVIPTPVLRSNKWVSSSVPEEAWKEEEALYSSPEYFTNNLLRSVLFEEASKHIPENAILVEIAPHGLLQAILKKSFPKATNISLTSRSSADNLMFLLQAIGKLYMAGLSPEINALYPKPSYPVASSTKSLHGLFPWCAAVKSLGTVVTAKSEIEIRNLLKKSNNKTVGHTFHGRRVTPFAYYPFLVWHTYYQADPTIINNTIIMKNVRIIDPFELSIEHDLCIEGIALTNSALVELTKDGKTFCSANAVKPEDGTPLSAIIRAENGQKLLTSLSKKDIYDCLKRQGYEIAKELLLLESVEILSGEMRGKIIFTTEWEKKMEAMIHLVYLGKLKNETNCLATVKSFGRIEVSNPKVDDQIPTELDIIYNTVTNELSCHGLTVSDIQFQYHSDHRTIFISSMLPYLNTPVKALQEYLHFCCQATDLKGTIKVLEIEHENFQPIASVVGRSFSQVQSVDEGYAPPKEEKMSTLVICSREHFNQHKSEMEDFILLREFPNADGYKEPTGFLKISSYVNNKENLVLLKKVKDVDGNKTFIIIPQKENELIKILKREQISRKIVVGFTEPSDGILNYINMIKLNTSLDISWFFILDEAAPAFDLNLPFYQEQLKKGLTLNVLLNGAWSFVYKKQLQINSRNTPRTIDENVQKKKKENSASGNNKLAINHDPDLSWVLPDSSWRAVNNKEEVIKAYALAYHCLAIQIATATYDKVLVTDGCSLLGQAAIAVALSRTDDVTASVANEEEVERLRRIFPQLNARRIILQSDNFIFNLKNKDVTGYPNIVYNLLEGNAIFDIICLAREISTIFHFGKEAIEANRQIIGTYSLIRYVRLIGVNAENTQQWRLVDKQKVQSLLATGIENGIVKPLKDIKNTKTTSIDTYTSSPEFKLDVGGDYLIIGDSSMVDLDIAQWLAQRGAKNIIIFNQSLSKKSEYRLCLRLLKNKQAKISHVGSPRELLSNFNENGAKKVHVTFFLNLVNTESIADTYPMLLGLSDKSERIVTISCDRKQALRLRNSQRTKIPQTNIIWNLENFRIKSSLDTVMSFVGEHEYFSVDNAVENKIQNNVLDNCIPNSIEELELMGSNLFTSSILIELPTSGPKMANSTLNCQPVFIIPGVEADAVETATILVKDLLEPAFVAKFEMMENISIREIAGLLAKEILDVNNRKIYHLVGISTGCIIAMEMARILEENGKVVALLLADNPYQNLREISGKLDISSSILDSFASDATKPLKDSSSNPNKLERSLDLTEESQTFVEKALNHISNTIRAAVSHNFNDLELNGPLTVIRSNDVGDDFPYSKICFDSYIGNLPENHRELLKSTRLTKVINKFIVLEDAPQSTVHEVMWVPFEKRLSEFRDVISQVLPVHW